MNKFKKELTLVIEGESSKEFLTNEELFSKLKISFINWWENNDWPYGKPCKELREIEVEKISLKND